MLGSGPFACLTDPNAPMSDFLRPEARAAIHRHRDLLIGVAVTTLGLYWALTKFGLLVWVGWAFVIAGVALIAAGAQRLRFTSAHGGVGIVTVKEGQITYLAPFNGGLVAQSEIAALILDRTLDPPVWIIRQLGQHDVEIPLNAEGAEKLFDAFSALDGLSMSDLLTALESDQKQQFVIWESRKQDENVPRLH